MNYLAASEYETFGLDERTAAGLVASASSLMDAHCRRTTLGVAQYQERLRLPWDRCALRLTYLPLAVVGPATTAIVTIRGRYVQPRNGEGWAAEFAHEVLTTFALPGTWVTMDPASIDFDAGTGELTLPLNILGLEYGEMEISYMAGLSTITDGVKTACAKIVQNAQATPALNVKLSRLDRMHMAYFSDTLIDQDVQALLAPYVAQKVG